jgi:hypothetical protein
MKPLEPQKFARKPIIVEAIQIDEKNMRQVAQWCSGDVRTDVNHRNKTKERYVKVRVFMPKTERQTMGFVTDWVLYAGTGGYKVYTDRAFRNTFDPLDQAEHTAVKTYRNAETGEYVSDEYAEEHPNTTVGETNTRMTFSTPRADADLS